MNDLIPSIYHSKEMFDTTIQRQALMVWLQIILLQKKIYPHTHLQSQVFQAFLHGVLWLSPVYETPGYVIPHENLSILVYIYIGWST